MAEGIRRKGYGGRDTAEGIWRKGYGGTALNGGRDRAERLYGGRDTAEEGSPVSLWGCPVGGACFQHGIRIVNRSRPTAGVSSRARPVRRGGSDRQARPVCAQSEGSGDTLCAFNRAQHRRRRRPYVTRQEDLPLPTRAR